MTRRFGPVFVAVALATFTACGDGGGASDGDAGTTDASEGEESALIDRLSDGLPYIATVDLVAVREQLGLEPDAEVEFALEEGDRYYGLAAVGLPYLLAPQEPPVAEAIDSGLVQEVVSSGPGFNFDKGAAVLRTEQDFDEIAEVLEDEGYEQEGGLLVSEEPSFGAAYPYVGNDGDIVVLAQSEEGALNALEAGDESLDSAAARMLDTVDQPARAAIAPFENPDCGQAYAVGVDAEPSNGVFVAYTGPDGDPDDALATLEDDPRLDALGIDRTGEDVDGDYVRVEFEYDPDIPLHTPLDLLTITSLRGPLYDC